MIAVYGGSFNPVTNAHMRIIKSLQENKKIDQVLVVPVGDNYKKEGLIDSAYRVDMLKLAVEGIEDVSVEDVEIVSEKLLSTYETMSILSEKYPEKELAFVLGADNLADFLNWDAEELLKDFGIIVVEREDRSLLNVMFENELFEKYSQNVYAMNLRMREGISSTIVRKKISEDKYNLNGVFTERDKMNKYVDSGIGKYIDFEVYKYIHENRLYLERKIG